MKKLSLLCLLFFLSSLCSPAYAQSNSGAKPDAELVLVRKSLDFTPYDLRVEYLKAPIGIDEMQPRFSWKIKSKVNGETPTAYQIIVSEKINRETVWDSGKVESPKMVGIEYAGSELQPEKVYLWKVTSWNKDGKESSTVQSSFSTGLNHWKGKWIGLEQEPELEHELKLDGAFWIWPEKNLDAPIRRALFRKKFELPEKNIKKGVLAFSADNDHKIFLNGKEVGTGSNFKAAPLVEVTKNLQSGENTFAIEVSNHGDAPNPAGLIGVLSVTFEEGETQTVKTDSSWKSVYDMVEGYANPDFDDSGWSEAAELVLYGGEPWGDVSLNTDRPSLPARYLRKGFQLENAQKDILRATAYISGLGYYELYLNGKKVGDHVLDPVLTDYDKRVPYVTYEIDPKSAIQKDNVLGVILGNGRYYAPRLTDPTVTRTFGKPKVLCELVIEYKDGSVQRIVTDESWQVSTAGPIRENNDYDGEIYDARLEIPNWSDVKFNEAEHGPLFSAVEIVAAPDGQVVAQMMPPMRVTAEIKPQSITEVRPGVWVFDFGQNLVGWCQLKVKGPEGTEIKLRHAETVYEEGPEKGMLYVDNLRNAKCRDIYTLKGKGEEVYHPRFAYHGFRFAELTGFPSRPNKDTLTACVVHTDLPVVGKFTTSSPLVNKLYKNIEWGVRGNYLSIPTDCPQRDERQGWQGDRAGESLGEMFLFDNYTLYSKWLKDIEDSQKEDGNVSDVCPNFWPLYSSNVTWPSAFTIIPNSLYRMYGDERPIRQHYEGMKKWMKHLEQFIRRNGTIDKDNYGDWCVPPERPELIHSQDPARKTAPGILATSYYINNLNLLAQFAGMRGEDEEAKEFRGRAEKMRAAFNKRFYNEAKGRYDNGTQTSCVLPLTFGLVPEGEENKVFATLTNNIEHTTNHHIGTGLIGGQWLNLTLDAFDRNDIAYMFLTNTDYPSWGYMVEKGATTIWELWNGNTADPAMNSGNHVMLVGDLIIWLYTRVAGIPIPEPGVSLVFAPKPGGQLMSVNAEYDSPYGLFKASWKIERGKFRYTVTIPVGQTATVVLPSDNLEASKELNRGKVEKSLIETVSRAGVTHKNVAFEVPSGTYTFECPYVE